MPDLLHSGLLKLPLFAIKVAQRIIHNHSFLKDLEMNQIPVKRPNLPKFNEMLTFLEDLPPADELETNFKCIIIIIKFVLF